MIDFKDLDNSSSEDKKKPPQSNVSFSEAAAGHEKKLFDKSAEDKIGTALYGKACGYLGKVFSAVGKDAGFSLEPGFQLVRSMVDNQSSSAALFIAALHRDDPDNFIINHCVNTAVFAIKMGVNLGFSHERQVEIGLAALLHDVGSARIRPGVMSKNGSLSPDELNLIKERPKYSYKILRSLQDPPSYLADTALQVYEKTDGSGYPQGLKDGEIHAYAQIIGLVDIYDALIHTRPWRDKYPHFSAVKEILKTYRNSFKRSYLKALLTAFSIFPLYSYVQLNSEAIGRVIETYPDQPMRPRLQIVYDSQKRKVVTRRMVNLPENPLLYIVDSVSEEALMETPGS